MENKQTKYIKIGDAKDCVYFLYRTYLMRFQYEIDKEEYFKMVEHELSFAILERNNGDIKTSNEFIKKAVILAQTYLLAAQTSKKLKKMFRFTNMEKEG